MSSYAQTFPQLHLQLREMGYAPQEIFDIQNTYGHATQLYAGVFQSNGKEILAHVIGTASILASLKAPPHIVAAGLLHNVYDGGNFGDGQNGITPARQAYLQGAVGDTIENLLENFLKFDWSPKVFCTIRDQFPQYDETKRTVLLLRITEHLEHNLDHGTELYSKEERIFRSTKFDILVDIAKLLGVPCLEKDFQQVFQLKSTSEIPAGFRLVGAKKSRKILAPKSCRKRFSVTIHERWRRGFQWFLSGFARRTRNNAQIV